MNIKKQLLSITILVSLFSALNSMSVKDYRRLPKKELIKRLCKKDTSLNIKEVEMNSKTMIIDMLLHKNTTKVEPKAEVALENIRTKRSLIKNTAIKLGYISAYIIPTLALLYFIQKLDIKPEIMKKPYWLRLLTNYHLRLQIL